MDNLSKRVSSFSSQQLQDLIRQLKLKENSVVSSILPLPRETNAFPLSFSQQRLWFLAQLEAEKSAYNMTCTFRLQGNLHIPALEQSINEIVHRHEVLRTSFTLADGQAVQVIEPVVRVPLPVVDLQAYPVDEHEAQTKHLALQQAQEPFDLTQAPLLRVTLLHIAPETHILVLTVHHIIFDGWSEGVLFQELADLYNAFVSGEPPSLPVLPVQYADFAVWQRQHLSKERLASLLTYWVQQLGKEPVQLDLPTDYLRPTTQSLKGAREPFVLSQHLTRALKQLSQREGTTLYMTLLAAFKVLLHRYTGQRDIRVGTPIAGRSHPELAGLLGCFINTLVLRTKVEGTATFRQLLNQVRSVALEAYEHQDLPFEKLIEALRPERDMSRSPLFQILFQLQSTPKKPLQLKGLTLQSIDIDYKVAQFDLSLGLWEESECLKGFAEYSTDLFTGATIKRLLGHFQQLLESIVEQPTQVVSRLPYLAADEQRKYLFDWNQTEIEYPPAKCIHEMFEKQVLRTPDALALIFEDQHLSYHELDCRANQLAHYLQDLGVGPEVRVGICTERSLEMVIGLLGILKAGGAYVPLEPSDPGRWLTFLQQDSQIRILLAQEKYRKHLSTERMSVVYIDTDWAHIQNESFLPVASSVIPQNLAYVLYTSGSTGTPKGVMNTHRGIYNRLLWMQQTYQLDGTDRILQKTPFSFDVSIWEFFWPLWTGASLIMLRPETHRDNVYLLKIIAEHNITTLHFVPSMLRNLLIEPDSKMKLCLRRVICSGEALPFDLQERYFARFSAPLSNLYGPTEASIDVTSWECERVGTSSSVPIGYPIANTRIYLLDPYLQPVPVGVPGEIYIGGIGLARGYLHQPALTAEKFVPDPSGVEAGARLYRSGDLARYRPDGAIEFLGRVDHQVKVRGIRIELQEIEAALSQHPLIHEVAVTLKEKGPEHKRLVAYIVSDPQATPTITDLRDYLKELLPSYMTPAAFLFLDTLPLTSSGKVDRRKLPEPSTARPSLTEAFVPPHTAIEKALAEIWAQVLSIKQIGIYDNFFSLGGDSMLSIRVLSLARERGLSISLQQLFRYQTIHAIAQQIAEIGEVPAPAPVSQAFSLLAEKDYLKLRMLNRKKREDA